MSDAFKDENPYLHIFGQCQWHDEAYIVANEQALLQLKKAIEDALLNGHGYVPAFVGDGEGFNTLIAKIDDPKDFDKLAVPYTDEIASEKEVNDRKAVWPWDMPRIATAAEDAERWIEKKYSKEEADEIKKAIAEERKKGAFG